MSAEKAGPSPGPKATGPSFFQNVAVDAEPYFAMNPELRVPAGQFAEFMRDIRGCVMGRKLAEKLRWRIGDHFFLESFASGLRKPDGPFEFVIRGLVDADPTRHREAGTDMMFFHFRYLETALGPGARPSLYMVEVDDAARSAETASAIDAAFENSSDPTLTQTEQAFLSDLMSMVGDVSLLLNGLGLAVCFAILFVTANTMSMAVRERRAEVAVLKTLGFTGAQVMGLVLAEALILGGLGGDLGLGADRCRALVTRPQSGPDAAGRGRARAPARDRAALFCRGMLLGLAAGARARLGRLPRQDQRDAAGGLTHGTPAPLQRPQRPRAVARHGARRPWHRPGGGRLRPSAVDGRRVRDARSARPAGWTTRSSFNAARRRS